MRNTSAFFWILAILALAGCTRQDPVALPIAEAGPLEDLTGAHTRVVWIREVAGEGGDALATGDHFVLMGLDTRDGLGERVILDTVDNYRKPLFTTGGERIVYTDLPEAQIHVVSWDGGGLRSLGGGMAIEVWQDPATGTEWVYYAEAFRTNVTVDGIGLMRMDLDAPERQELVWDQTDVTPDNFQLSADGKRAAGLFPWKQWSVLDLTTMTLHPQGKGCWTSMAPDNSYLSWVFDGAHKNLLLTGPGAPGYRQVPLNRAPGMEGHEVYHPRWSNQVRFLALTGPYKVMGRYNAILGGGTGINAYVGRFNADLTEVEAWAQVTDHDDADLFPDVWIAGAAAPTVAVAAPVEPVTPAPTADTLRLTGRLVEISETPSIEAIRPYTSTLVEYVYDVVSVEQGECDADRIIVQHWGIRDSEYQELNQQIGTTLALALQPVSANPWLQGERVSSTIEDITLDVFLDVSQPPPTR